MSHRTQITLDDDQYDRLLAESSSSGRSLAELIRLLDALEWIPVDELLADAAGSLARQWSRAYPGVDAVDFVVAATAQSLGAEPTTRNIKHFPMFPGLRAPY